MKEYWNSVQSSLEQLNQTVTRVLIQFSPEEQAAKKYERFHTARMSHTRLKALEGTRDRQSYMDKLREDAAHTVSAVRWSKDSEAESPESPEEAEEKRKRQLWRAVQRQSQARLQAWVATLSPEEIESNEREGKRLEGASWQLPKGDGPTL